MSEAFHQADMIAEVYERLVRSMPKNFAAEMTYHWFAFHFHRETTVEFICPDCGGGE